MTSLSQLTIAELQAEREAWVRVAEDGNSWNEAIRGASQLRDECSAWLARRQLESASGKVPITERAGNYEAQRIASEPKPDPEGWIAWAGGEWAGSPDTIVEVMLYSKDKCCGYAHEFVWTKQGKAYDVIEYRAYRLTPAAKQEQD